MLFFTKVTKVAGVVCLLTIPAVATAQERPFAFSVAIATADKDTAVSVHYDAGFGERPFDVVAGERVDQRIGLHASFGNGFTLLGRVGVSTDGSTSHSSQQAELLYRLRGATEKSVALAAGMGTRHEFSGTNVLLGRVTIGRSLDAWHMDGNAIFEKPFSSGRDAVDVITSVGVSRQVSAVIRLGVEAVGEDLEGFWEAEEAEGGARILIGPSLHFAPRSRRWQLTVAGGPIVHATRSAQSSDANRALPATNGRNGYAIRTSLTYGF